jgi:hypothetical protein
MNRLFADSDVGRKNVGFGVGLFVILGVVVGIPLTADFLGGSWLTSEQYQTWKVVHAYGVFLSFVNFFFGLAIDRLSLTKQQKEITSWCFLLAGVAGGLVRMALLLASALDDFAIYVSLTETVLFVAGTFILVRGQVMDKRQVASDEAIPALQSHNK